MSTQTESIIKLLIVVAGIVGHYFWLSRNIDVLKERLNNCRETMCKHIDDDKDDHDRLEESNRLDHQRIHERIDKVIGQK